MKKIFTLLAGVLFALGAQAQIASYTLDINKIYEDAVNATGQCANATQSDGTKYLLNDATIVQDVFTVVSKSNRTYRIDRVMTDSDDNLVPIEYDSEYTASYRLEPNGASNSTGGRQMFLEAAGPGKLYLGTWGNSGRKVAVIAATDKTSYYNVANASSTDFVYEFTADETKALANDVPQIIEVDIPKAGIYCITQDSGIYFAYVKFEQTSEGVPDTPSDPTAPTTWNFTQELSSSDAANLEADATWVFDAENGYWTNNAQLAERNVYTTLKANGAELELAQGLEFTRDNSAGLGAEVVRITPGKNIALNGSKNIIKLGELAKDDVIKIRLKGAGDSERTLTPQNAEITEGSLTTTDTDVHEATLKVLADGIVTFTTGNGFQFFAITINADLPEDTTGISVLKAETIESEGAIYNLQGQRVDANYRGVVIKNGRKVVNK